MGAEIGTGIPRVGDGLTPTVVIAASCTISANDGQWR